jgi:AcrR family transcriptional regulator
MAATESPLSDAPAHKGRTRKKEEAVLKAVAQLLLEEGHRDLRTARIAVTAGITESTLFRTYGKLPELLSATDEWAWSVLVQKVADAAFVRPQMSARDALLADTELIWSLREDPETELAATFAILYFRRKGELDLTASESERKFTDRIARHCQGIFDAEHDEPAIARLATLVLNYVATIWLTWRTMPLGARDITPLEAQLGVLVLIERFTQLEAGAPSSHERDA